MSSEIKVDTISENTSANGVVIDSVTLKDGAIGAAGTATSIAGLPIYVDSSNGSVYTHDVSGTDSTAQYNTAYGITALDAITTGDYNIAIGYNAGTANTTGNHNTIVGATAAQANTEGTSLVAIGPNALQTSDTETHNLAIGRDSMNVANSGGEYNVAIGNYSLDALTSADYCVGVGYNAGTAIQGGHYNTGIGYNVIGSVVSGEANTGLGYGALDSATGSHNIGIGYLAGDNITSGSKNTCIGSLTDVAAAGNEYSIVIGYDIDGTGTDTFNFGRASNVVSNTFSSNASFSRSSDGRKKTNVKDSTLGLDFINELRPVTFNWKPNNEFPKEFKDYKENVNDMNTTDTLHGMIAQDVKAALDKAGVDTFGGWSEEADGSQRISQEMFVHPLIKAVQELSAKVKALEEA